MSRKKKKIPVSLRTKEDREEEVKTKKVNKTYVIGGVVLGVLAIVAVALAVILPIVKINAEFDALFETVNGMEQPKMVITDMKAENNFSDSKGEINIDSAASAKAMIKSLSNIAGKFEYDGRRSSIEAWDIRVKFINGDQTVTMYFAKDGMYYVKNNAKYVFVPEDDETKIAYEGYYNTLCVFLK